MEKLNLTVDKREIVGKKVATLRKEGITPVHLYGNGVASQSLQCDSTQLSKIIYKAKTNIPVTIEVSGTKESNLCFIREVQYHPVTDTLIHVDFFRVDIDKLVRAEVPIKMEGLSPVVRSAGGTLLQPLRSVTVEALPLNIPEVLILQSDLLVDFDTRLYVKDIFVDDSIKIINGADSLVATVVAPRVEKSDSELAAENSGEETTDAESESEGAQ
jgi:large subunit ribosomal protein L25